MVDNNHCGVEGVHRSVRDFLLSSCYGRKSEATLVNERTTSLQDPGSFLNQASSFSCLNSNSLHILSCLTVFMSFFLWIAFSFFQPFCTYIFEKKNYAYLASGAVSSFQQTKDAILTRSFIPPQKYLLKLSFDCEPSTAVSLSHKLYVHILNLNINFLLWKNMITITTTALV